MKEDVRVLRSNSWSCRYYHGLRNTPIDLKAAEQFYYNAAMAGETKVKRRGCIRNLKPKISSQGSNSSCKAEGLGSIAIGIERNVAGDCKSLAKRVRSRGFESTHAQ